MPSLRISVVEPSGQLYGSELCLLDIMQGFDVAAYDTEVLLPRGAPFRKRLEHNGIACRELLWGGAWTAPRWKKMLGYLRLLAHWREERPGLIYVNQGGILRPVAMIAHRLRIPVLCQVQTLEDAHWVSGLASWHRTVSTFVCNSQFTAGHCHVPKDRLSTVYYGYKVKGLRRANRSKPLNANGLVVGLLGRICESKGHHLVIEAIRRMKATGTAPMRFRFVGDAPTVEERAKIGRMAKDSGLLDAIEFRGYQANLAEEFGAMDVLAIPSVAEPFGRVFCEAAEAGVPVVLSDSGGLGELSRRFDIGIRHLPMDMDDFIAKLLLVCTDYEGCVRQFSAGAKRLLGALDYRIYVKEIENLLLRAATGEAVALEWYGEPPV